MCMMIYFIIWNPLLILISSSCEFWRKVTTPPPVPLKEFEEELEAEEAAAKAEEKTE